MTFYSKFVQENDGTTQTYRIVILVITIVATTLVINYTYNETSSLGNKILNKSDSKVIIV